ncbi:MAG: phosphatase PAP2 family protein, partial [Gammaproteobacteria bacterium]|nr:phosphatase PAP2 family protein [Gammaproteobacteria bacterium]NIR97467.1 phosphatase PAP2 family protein [Gammaproteobacteria bacterium]NIT63092.1 phosphatase PAP2 family protein [Gammaproteobacteria bacterium]NIV20054.1 phosphatase PAP2 family protein [Gammaproteobacteria bacterium]NIX10162.1 phosphatase PAP2 family protein [Gammaproteobacteria bacterium]
VVGVVVPGALFMLAVGALIALGALEFWSSLAWAAAGAVAGDGVSFWVGYRYREQLRGLPPFRSFPRLFARGEAFFQRHGGKSIVFGRFVGPVRAVIPTVAGMMAMPPARFAVVNVLSALAWAPAYVIPGVVFGASLELASEVAARLVVVLLLVVMVLLLTAWVVRRVFGFLQPRTGRLIDATLTWSDKHPWLGPVAAALVDPRYPESRALIPLAGLLLAGGLTFFGVLSYVLGKAGSTGLDATVHNLMRSLRTPWADSLMVAVTMVGDAVVYVPLSAAVLLWLLIRRNTPAAVHWAAAVGFGIVLTQVLKIALQVPRPADLYAGPSSFSFPSGHATMSTVIYGFVAVLLSRELPPRLRRIPYVAAGVIVASIATSRIYLGAHWLSDVLGGLALGLAWIALLGIAYRRHPSPHLPAAGFTVVTLVAAMAVASLHIGLHHAQELERYTPRVSVQAWKDGTWWRGEWRRLPTYRDDLVGHHEHPMNVQWAGPLSRLAVHLGRRGWEPPRVATVSSVLHWMNPHATLPNLPVLPHVHAGRHEALTLVRPGRAPDTQWVLRLWPANVRLQPSDRALWLGSVSQQELTRAMGLLRYPVTTDRFDRPLGVLRDDLAGLSWKPVKRAREALARWDGTVLLAREPGEE